MRRLRRYAIIGIVFVLVMGTLAHFLYEWSGSQKIIGLFAPVNESVWEHMKLVFFPMLLYAPFMVFRLREDCPCILSSLCSGLLAGTLAIPVLFYGYTFILGRDVFFLDIAVFILSVLIAFWITYRLALYCRPKLSTVLSVCFVGILFGCFLWFTYHPPKGSLFADPTAGQKESAFSGQNSSGSAAVCVDCLRN